MYRVLSALLFSAFLLPLLITGKAAAWSDDDNRTEDDRMCQVTFCVADPWSSGFEVTGSGDGKNFRCEDDCIVTHDGRRVTIRDSADNDELVINNCTNCTATANPDGTVTIGTVGGSWGPWIKLAGEAVIQTTIGRIVRPR